MAVTPLDNDSKLKNPPYRMRGETETEFLERDPVFMETMRKVKDGTAERYTLTDEDRKELLALSEKGDIEAIDALYERIVRR